MSSGATPGSRARRIAATLILLAGLAGSWFTQSRLSSERERLGLTRTAVISNAPPVLAFTTVALGGFRGLIANALWIRTTDLQDDGKYFEAVQLADWITKLQPHFTAVWVYQAWNMAYNISVKFPDVDDRWPWVLRGIELLRDEGLRYNPDQALMYRELAWIFHHKMGANLDDAHWKYKSEWKALMEKVLPGGRPDYPELLSPTSAAGAARVAELRNRYKLDPAAMKRTDERYGPLDWRLPETHAIYWALQGIEHSPQQDKVPLRREIFQPMLAAFHHGRIVTNRFASRIEIEPNLDIVPNVSRAYEDAIAAEPDMAEHLGVAHRNFLGDAVYFLYANNREKEAARWFEYLRQKYGFGPQTGIPEGTLLSDYVLKRVLEDINATSRDRVTAMLVGFIRRAYSSIGSGEAQTGAGYMRLAERIHENFVTRINLPGSSNRVALAPFSELQRNVLLTMLAPSTNINPDFQNVLRTQLRLPASFGSPGSNAPAAAAGSGP